jgi:hypothetical protein
MNGIKLIDDGVVDNHFDKDEDTNEEEGGGGGG